MRKRRRPNLWRNSATGSSRRPGTHGMPGTAMANRKWAASKSTMEGFYDSSTAIFVGVNHITKHFDDFSCGCVKMCQDGHGPMDESWLNLWDLIGISLPPRNARQRVTMTRRPTCDAEDFEVP